MHCAEHDSPPYITYLDGPYGSSIASSASSSSASVWSDAASQSSDDSSVTGASDSELLETCPPPSLAADVAPLFAKPQDQVAPEQRQHPRRTSVGAASQARCPPSLVRQCDRKVSFVDSLVDSSSQIVETIWPLSSAVCRNEVGNKGVLPLRTFIQETLRRSRTSYSTLQVALYYLILIKPHVPKHDFTMEQPDETHSNRALQCGRRMFLSALILASKYLQDRNYSARAWSKISGLHTLEINQNEIAFLLAVNWELHITDDVFQRWTDIVLKYTPNQPPAPGPPSSQLVAQAAEWKAVILKLNPELDNIPGAFSSWSAQENVQTISATAPRSFTPAVADRTSLGYGSNDSTPTPNYYTPSVLEPSPTSIYPPTRFAPALGLLPTPRLTPQSSGFNTPAVSAASYLLSSKSSMSMAMAHAGNVTSSQLNDRWQTSSPSSFISFQRSYVANSRSLMSSPESMISDTSSRNSRSSSISSASSMAAPISSKSLDIQARCRSAKLCSERQNRVMIASVPEYCDNGTTASPETYTIPVGKGLLDMSLETSLARRAVDCDYLSKDEEAARALQELHSHPRSSDSPNRGAKRSRPRSMDQTLQEHVREMLLNNCAAETQWSEDLTRQRAVRASSGAQVPVESATNATIGRKRVCCASEAKRGYPQTNNLHLSGPGMWQGILN